MSNRTSNDQSRSHRPNTPSKGKSLPQNNHPKQSGASKASIKKRYPSNAMACHGRPRGNNKSAPAPRHSPHPKNPHYGPRSTHSGPKTSLRTNSWPGRLANQGFSPDLGFTEWLKNSTTACVSGQKSAKSQEMVRFWQGFVLCSPLCDPPGSVLGP